jgi:hypothetical protein
VHSLPTSHVNVRNLNAQLVRRTLVRTWHRTMLQCHVRARTSIRTRTLGHYRTTGRGMVMTCQMRNVHPCDPRPVSVFFSRLVCAAHMPSTLSRSVRITLSTSICMGYCKSVGIYALHLHIYGLLSLTQHHALHLRTGCILALFEQATVLIHVAYLQLGVIPGVSQPPIVAGTDPRAPPGNKGLQRYRNGSTGALRVNTLERASECRTNMEACSSPMRDCRRLVATFQLASSSRITCGDAWSKGVCEHTRDVEGGMQHVRTVTAAIDR